MNLKKLSIIIPVGPNEDQLQPLLDDLTILPEETEIILVTAASGKIPQPPNFDTSAFGKRLRRVQAAPGRASQQNAGARAAQRSFLWFLHADSRVSPKNLVSLDAALGAAPDALHYFHLRFLGDGAKWMWINQWGARFRSEILGLPFGDQGFCLKGSAFTKIGGFPEQAKYGEDHLLVWHARQAGIRLRCTGTALQTSARKYRQHGWFALTIRYQFLWIRQALPELWKVMRRR